MSATKNLLADKGDSVLKNTRRKRRDVFGFYSTSTSVQPSTTQYFLSRAGDVPSAVDYLSQVNGLQWITITPLDSSEVCCVSFATSGSLEPEVLTFLSRRQLMFQTRQLGR